MTKEKRFIAASADVCGNVQLGENSSIWYQAVLRGDNQTITIGRGSNIQDGSVIHVDPNFPVRIGEYVTVGHQCMLHGCEVQDGALLGMGSILLNGSVIGKSSLIGAGSLVTEGTVIPEGVLAFGRPAKVIRTLTEEEIAKNKENAEYYIKLAREHQAGSYPRTVK
ncbi:gamma carbonic anhydrase family protein [Enterococcus sp. BWB1-3]|uniref:gamma carbonic anhydrase family protein n=1 Tax=Enterococcus sp. BWB1-3 TaxID=2787713 RepID=UPI0019209684|nr:gamma carbonic anhydrase family protein [Enterococcus sp. BWB1-3]MBL1228887.1 gamma carbonic anhydrase family protein [Enterococcus sp. BWB1-3]